jgi:hypothetical protein
MLEDGRQQVFGKTSQFEPRLPCEAALSSSEEIVRNPRRILASAGTRIAGAWAVGHFSRDLPDAPYALLTTYSRRTPSVHVVLADRAVEWSGGWRPPRLAENVSWSRVRQLVKLSALL